MIRRKYIIKIICKAGELCRELDKIDSVWYNATVESEYRNFDGNIYRKGSPNVC